MKSLKNLKQLTNKYVAKQVTSILGPASILKNFGSPKYLPHDSEMASYIFFQYLESWLQLVVKKLKEILKKSKINQDTLKELNEKTENKKPETFGLLTIMKEKSNQQFLYDTLKLFNSTRTLTNKFDILFYEINKCSKLVSIPPDDSENFPNKLDQIQSFFKGKIYDLISSRVLITNYSNIATEEVYIQPYIADELSDEEWNNLYRWIIHFFNVMFVSYGIYRDEFEIMATETIKKFSNWVRGTPETNSKISKVNIRKFNLDNKSNLDNNGKKLYQFVEKISMLAGKKKIFDSAIIQSAQENFENLKKVGVKIEDYEFLKVLLDFASLKKDNTT